MRTALFLAVVAAILVAPPVSAESASDAADADFDLPGEDIGAIIGDGGLDLSDVDFVGNPARSLIEKWPEDLVMAPIPGYSPQLGWNLTLAGGFFLGGKQEESGSPPSVLGGFAMRAENGSYAYGGGANFHLLDDKLRVAAGAGYADIQYRFYGIGNDTGRLDNGINILQQMPMYFVTAKWRVWKRLYLGLGYLGGDVETRTRLSLPDLPYDPTLNLGIGAYVVPVEYDSRDHEQFPRQGWLVNGRATLYRKSAGSDFETGTFKFSANHYRPVGDRDVFAFRAMLRTTNGDTPFFLLSTFGGSTDLRGYPSGRYRDRTMYALQGEYRWQFSDRWIFTGFAGFGEVAESIGDMGENFLPATGIGARFVLSQKHRVGLSVDLAAGNDGTEFYFGIGEAF